MITIKSPFQDSTIYSDKVYVDYSVSENSKFTDKVVFVLDGVKQEKIELSGVFTYDNLTEGSHLLRVYLVNKFNKIIVGSEKKIKFDVNLDVIYLKNRLSDTIESRIPSFIREDYSTFVTFIEKYYKFLEQSNEPSKVPFAQAEFKDVDFTPQILLDKFKKLFIPDFPEQLAVDRQTGKPLNLKTLIKRAKQFYQSKGTEKSYDFLFRVLFDTDVEIFYPRTKMMIVSGGLWVERKTLKVLVNDTDRARALVGKIIYQRDVNGLKINRARVKSCQIYMQSPYKVAEFEIDEINGTFQYGKIYSDVVYQDAEETIEFSLRRGISTINITSGGLNYTIGDVVKLTPATNGSGVGYTARVLEVDQNGAITKLQTVNFGFNYEQNPIGLYDIQVTTVGGTGFDGVPESTVLCEYAGYYKNSNSVLGSDNYIQDNYYYQTHSYELKSDIPKESYEDTIKRMVHPSGYMLFGELLLKPTLLLDPASLSNVKLLVSNFIGNYLPYTINSSINLRNSDQDLFPDGFNPSVAVPPQTGAPVFIHDPLDNPISTKIENAFYSTYRSLPDVSDINQKANYWVVFPHPNFDLNTNETLSSFMELTIETLAVVDNTNNTIIGDEF
jgi:hypothetical protein